ncbi:lamin tail domain-containing protein [Mycoplasmatota bacterium WC30]
MFKKNLLFTFSLFSLMAIVACGGDTTTQTTSEITTQTTIEATTQLTTETTTHTTTETFTTTQTTTETTTQLTTETTTVFTYELTDLSGNSKTEIETLFDNLGLSYIFEFETNLDITENSFIRYGGEDQIGNTIEGNHQIIIVLATPKLILPDLTGKNQTEMITALITQGINFNIEIVTDNTIPDQTFSGYGDNFEAGDLVSSRYTVTVYLGFNSARLPDLSEKSKEEITSILNADNIIHVFEYIFNDEFPEDTFVSYEGMVAGDYYEEGTITVNIYKNTFTDNETSLIISKYVDGGNDTSDQAIEIFNSTTLSIDLSEYYLAIFTNGSYTETYHIAFPEIDLLPGETYVIGNTGANANILAKTDLVSDDLVFDGNDTIQICYMNGTYIDTIYNLGNKNFIMDDEVFIRNISVVTGAREYIFTQWYGYVPTYVEVLGTHPIVIPTEITFEYIDREFYDPLGGMDSVILSYISDGDTAGFTPGFIGEERVRFLGVDTPETYPYVDDWGLEAKAYTTLILNSAENIYIQSDPDLGYTETYGRHLGLIWVDLGTEGLTIDILSSDGQVMRTEVLSGWILLNYHLVLNGYSYNYYGSESKLVFNNRYLIRWFQEAERFAQNNGLGIHE